MFLQTEIPSVTTSKPNISLTLQPEQDAHSAIDENTWADKRPNDTAVTNETALYPPFQTVFRLDDYLQYEHEAGSAENGVVRSQNQMLPIYCSIMGLIIVFLLFYVVYKLWRQRETMIKAKLSDGYMIGSCNGIKSRAVVSQTRSIAAQSSERVSLSQAGLAQTKNLQRPTPATEQDSLLHNADHFTPETDQTEKLISALDSSSLGSLCLSLAENGWQRLATLANLPVHDQSLMSDSGESSSIYYETILQASLEAKRPSYTQAKNSGDRLIADGMQTEPDQDLKSAARVLTELCSKPSMTLESMKNSLSAIDRADLLPYLTVHPLPLECSHDQKNSTVGETMAV